MHHLCSLIPSKRRLAHKDLCQFLFLAKAHILLVFVLCHVCMCICTYAFVFCKCLHSFKYSFCIYSNHDNEVEAANGTININIYCDFFLFHKIESKLKQPVLSRFYLLYLIIKLCTLLSFVPGPELANFYFQFKIFQPLSNQQFLQTIINFANSV